MSFQYQFTLLDMSAWSKDLVHFHVNPLVNHVIEVGRIAPKPPEHN